MSPDPRQAKAIFLDAVDQPHPGERDRFLDVACHDNPDLRREVEILLAAHAKAASFLEEAAVAAPPTVDLPCVAERPGTQIGPYQLIQQIGQGGMGVVYLAAQREPVQRKVALKIIKPGMDTREVIARFQAEEQALALMDHPNIARVHDADTTESGRPYFVMELVNGVTLTRYCDDNNLTTRERLELFVSVCHAVQHAHQKGIIHRDLKPSNILVTMHDGVPVPKIIDFGIAKAIHQQLTATTVYTSQGQLIGTPLYMSPEQAEPSGLDIDTRSDIYSLGVLLYELLTGSTPFDREQLKDVGYDEVRRLIREQEPPRPSTRISTLGELATTVSEHRRTSPVELSNSLRHELDWIVMKALEKDRTRRYQTANDFARDIERYLGDEPVEACPPSTAYRLKKFVRRHKSGVLATAAVSLAILLGAGIAAGQAYRATQAEQVAEEQLHIAQQQQRVAEQQTQLAQQQTQLAQQQKQRAEKQQQLAEHQRQLAVEIFVLTVAGIDVHNVQTGPDGTVFAALDSGQVLRCDAETGRLLGEFGNFGRQGRLNSDQRMFFGNDRNHDGHPEVFLAMPWGEAMQILDGVTGELIATLSAAPAPTSPKFFGRDEFGFGPDGLLYDLQRGSIHRFDGGTLKYVDTFVKSASPTDRLDHMTHNGTFVFGRDGNIYAALWGLHNVQRFSGRTGQLLGELVVADAGRLNSPRDMAFGRDGNLYVVTANHVLTYGGSDGKLLGEMRAKAGQQFHRVFFQPSGKLCVSADDSLLRREEQSGELELFIRYGELKSAYLAHRISEEPSLLAALSGSGMQNTLAWSLVWLPGLSQADANVAVQLALKAVQSSPENGRYWHTLGAAYYRAGRWQESQAAMSNADRLCGPTALVDFYLSMAHSKMGHADKARASYDRACELLQRFGEGVDPAILHPYKEAAELMGIAVSLEYK